MDKDAQIEELQIKVEVYQHQLRAALDAYCSSQAKLVMANKQLAKFPQVDNVVNIDGNRS